MTDGADRLRVPDAKRPSRLIPVNLPSRVGDLRFAATDDGTNEDGSPVVSRERGYVTDPAERERLLGYLTGGATVLDDLVYGVDQIDPSRHFAVPSYYHSDGCGSVR
jgi:hypothetical protein